MVHILRTLRKEGDYQSELDILNTIVLPNINYALSVKLRPIPILHLCNVSWAAFLKGNTPQSL